VREVPAGVAPGRTTVSAADGGGARANKKTPRGSGGLRVRRCVPNALLDNEGELGHAGIMPYLRHRRKRVPPPPPTREGRRDHSRCATARTRRKGSTVPYGRDGQA